jgi:hypothetical protein
LRHPVLDVLNLDTTPATTAPATTCENGPPAGNSRLRWAVGFPRTATDGPCRRHVRLEVNGGAGRASRSGIRDYCRKRRLRIASRG